MAFDFDVKWQSELDASIEAYLKGPWASGGVRARFLENARVEGTVRLVLTPLGSEGPGFGASLLSFEEARDRFGFASGRWRGHEGPVAEEELEGGVLWVWRIPCCGPKGCGARG